MSNTLILGVDSGNHKAKVVGPFGVDSFRTNICEWFIREVEVEHGSDDMEFNIDGRSGYAGTIAMLEDDFDGGGSMFGDSKNHDDNKMRVILAIHRYLQKYSPETTSVKIVTGQPIKQHNNIEKQGIIDMLKGPHHVTVNKVTQILTIEEVIVSPEGSAAFWSNPREGTVRILDIGSGTVNAATIVDKKHVNARSATYNFGMENSRNKDDLPAMARGIIRNTTALKWQRNDLVLVCGGITNEILPHIKQHYTNAEALVPKLNSAMKLTPVYANAAGFYAISKKVFK